jgi:hypothetical protein
MVMRMGVKRARARVCIFKRPNTLSARCCAAHMWCAIHVLSSLFQLVELFG